MYEHILRQLNYFILHNLDDEVEKLRIQENIPYSVILKTYTALGYHKKVDEYCLQLKVPINEILYHYAQADNHDKIWELYLNKRASIVAILNTYILVKNFDQIERLYTNKHISSKELINLTVRHQRDFTEQINLIEKFRTKFEIPIIIILEAYANKKHHYHIKRYIESGIASLEEAAQVYARVYNYKMLKLYLDMHPHLIKAVLLGFAETDNHKALWTYQKRYGRPFNDIACAYAEAGKHDKAVECINQYGASPDVIAQTYAKIYNHDKVREFITKYNVPTALISMAYAEVNNHEMASMFDPQYKASMFYSQSGLSDEAITNEQNSSNIDPSLASLIDNYYTLFVDNPTNTKPAPLDSITEQEIPESFPFLAEQEPLDSLFPDHEYLLPPESQEAHSQDNFSSEQTPPQPVGERTHFDDLTTLEILYSDQEHEKNTPPFTPPTIRGGIHTKYLANQPHPRLPALESAGAMNKEEYDELRFIPVHSLATGTESHYFYPIDNESFNASLISLNPDIGSALQQWTFICAGRKTNALFPQTLSGQCVLICTREEQNELMPYLTPNLHLLVVSKISSHYYGEYEHLQSIAARRLAAFLFSFYFEIDAFALLDDNIKYISLQRNYLSSSPSWDELFAHLSTQVEDKGCLSIATVNRDHDVDKKLGAKLFLVNMRLIRQKLSEAEHFFFLFPDSTQILKWGEDYYFQIFLHYLLQEHSLCGYQVMPPENMSLTRSQQHLNSFAATGKKAEHFTLPQCLNSIASPLQEVLKNTVNSLNQLITENYTLYAAKSAHIANTDLLELHAQANQQTCQPSLLAQEPVNDFKTAFFDIINEYDFEKTTLRDYQTQAIKAIPPHYQFPSRFVMATASGKTLIQNTIALMAYHAANPGQHIFIVTPQIDLVIQFYKDLMAYNQDLIEKNNDISIPHQAIVTVSNHARSLSTNALKSNNLIRQQKAIIICCEDSFKKLFDTEEQLIQSASLILLDEYHEYPKTLKPLCEKLTQPMLIASSATPPPQDIISNTLYSFNLKRALRERYHAPIVSAPMNLNYSPENVAMLIQCLPALLRSEYHPGFANTETLADTKGIIYFESINLCEEALAVLHQANIDAYAIHTNNEQASLQAQQFVRSPKPGVLLAVRKLRFGFDCPDLAWEIIARKPTKESATQDMEQMLGRVIRPYQSKIGLVITFNDIHHRHLRPLIAVQKKTYQLSMDFLANTLRYHRHPDGQIKVVDPDEALDQDINISKKRKSEEELSQPVKKLFLMKKKDYFPGFFSKPFQGQNKDHVQTNKPDTRTVYQS